MISEMMGQLGNVSLTNAMADIQAEFQMLPEKMAHVGQKVHETITGVPTYAAKTTNVADTRVHVENSSHTSTGQMWYNFGDQLVNIFNGIRPFVIGLVVVALIVEAIGCIIGGEQSRQRFKQALPWIIGAAILILMALTVAQGIVNGAQDDFSAGDKYQTTPAS